MNGDAGSMVLIMIGALIAFVVVFSVVAFIVALFVHGIKFAWQSYKLSQEGKR